MAGKTRMRAQHQVEDTLEDKDGDTKVMVEESTDEDKIRFVTVGVQRVIIDESGQVGIGPLSDPYSQLVISQNTAATFAMHAFSDTPGAAGQLKMDKSRGTADSPSAVQAGDSLGSVGFRGQTKSDGSIDMGQAASISVKAVTSGSSVSSPAGSIRFFTREEVVAGVNTSDDRMIIAHGGNVGIGSSAFEYDDTPATLLTLSGSEAYLTLQNKDNEHSDGGAETRINFNDHSGATLAQIQGSHDGTDDDTKGDLTLSTHDGSNLSQRIKIESSGHVGVGPEVAPFSSLHVNSESTNGTSVTLDAVNDSAAAGSFHRIYRARGTTSARTTAQPGDSVGSFSWWGYSEDSYRQVGGIAVQLVQSGTATSSPAGQMVFFGTKHVPGGTNAFNQNMIMKDDGKIGIGTFGNAIYDSEVSTLLTLSGSEAYLTLQNETDEHTDGGAETRVNFNDHSGTTLARIQGSHDGTGDDTKGDLIFSTHDGSSLNEAMRIESSGQVGIGPLSDPYSQLVVSKNTAATFAMHGFSNTPGAAGQLKMDKSRGTADSPTAVQADDTLGSIGFRGQTRSDGSSVMGQAASISVKAVTSGSSVSSPAGTIRFFTREEVVGGVNTSAIRMVIAHDGKVGIGTETPDSKLHLSSTSTDDLLFLETTEDSNSASPVIKLKRNSGSPADADYLGQLKFQGENDADQNVTYAKITGKIGSVSDGAEQGIIEFANMKNGSSGITARFKHDALQLVNSTNLTVDGSLGIGTTSPTESLDIDSDSIRLRQSKTPSSASDTGKAGQIAWDSEYIYICIATNTWKRAALSTW